MTCLTVFKSLTHSCFNGRSWSQMNLRFYFLNILDKLNTLSLIAVRIGISNKIEIWKQQMAERLQSLLKIYVHFVYFRFSFGKFFPNVDSFACARFFYSSTSFVQTFSLNTLYFLMGYMQSFQRDHAILLGKWFKDFKSQQTFNVFRQVWVRVSQQKRWSLWIC